MRKAKAPSFHVNVTQEILDEARGLGLTGCQMISLAIIRPTAPKAPVVVRGKWGTAEVINGEIVIGGGYDD
jgi:hypothetical protein